MAGSLNDTLALNLDYLLDKEHIIPTYTSDQLKKAPTDVERQYAVHAKTHVSLGDTQKYVQTIIKWVSGQNAGAFIGGVVGDYGEGKTSFMVHVWDECQAANVLAVPPFSWRSQQDIINGVHAWLAFKLKETRPDEARAVQKIWEQYREKSLEEKARQLAHAQNKPFEDVYELLSADALDVNLQISSEEVLNYLEQVSESVVKAGFQGLLVQLDEPEVAAKSGNLSTNEVGQILFDFANGLLGRKGNYGIFVSMPKNFLAQVQTAFSSLLDRLQGRKCFPSLASFYHDRFARELWERYAETLAFQDIKHAIIAPSTLTAIGQVTSAKRRDLSSGPRSVISVFRRAVELYKEDQGAYTPLQFIEDCLDQEVSVTSYYQTSISEICNSQEAEHLGKDVLSILCAFPEGIPEADLADLGVPAEDVLERIRPGHPLLYKRSGYVGLKPLLTDDEQTQQDVLRDAIQDAMNQYAPRPKIFSTALKAFAAEIVPFIFKEREGHSLLGWKLGKLSVAPGHQNCYRMELEGAFPNTQDYPRRKVHLFLSDDPEFADSVRDTYSGPESPDLLIHLCLAWRSEASLPAKRVQLDPGDPEIYQPALLELVLDLSGQSIEHEGLLRYVEDEDLLTPLAVLYLLGEISKLSLPQQDSGIWKSMRSNIPTKLTVLLFGDDALRQQLAEIEELRIPGAAADLIATLYRYLIMKRFPDYHTLIIQANWQKKIQTYASVIDSSSLPLSVRRGQEPWIVEKAEVARLFGMSTMNLDGWLSDMESLVSMKPHKGNKGKVELDFKIHPMEQKIQDTIMESSQDKRIKIDGVEVWSIPQAEILPLVLTSGYQVEELKEIVNIGLKRGSFIAESYRGSRYLYVKPLDPEQLRAKLREKLTDFKARAEQLKRIPSYRADTDVVGLEQSIAEVKEETDFERVENELNRAFEKDNARLQSFFGDLASAVEGSQKSLAQYKRDLGARAVTSIKQANPKASSRWVSTYKQKIVENLQHNFRQAESELGDLQTQAQRIIELYSRDKSGDFSEKVQRLDEGWKEHGALESKRKRLDTDIKRLVEHASDNEAWQTLLNDSDARSDELSKDKNVDDEDFAAALRTELQEIWEDIETHLDSRGLDALASHKQYAERLSGLGRKYLEHRQQRKARFDQEKNRANSLLGELGAARVNETFNPNDLSGCYSRLYNAVSGAARDLLGKQIEVLEKAQIELRYQHAILGRIPEAKYAEVYQNLLETQQALQKHSDGLNEAEVRQVVQADADTSVFEDINSCVQRAVEHVSETNKLQHEHKADSEPSASAQALEKHLDGKKDLKAVILEQMGDADAPETILDASLESLAELFRKGRINISIEPLNSRR